MFLQSDCAWDPRLRSEPAGDSMFPLVVNAETMEWETPLGRETRNPTPVIPEPVVLSTCRVRSADCRWGDREDRSGTAPHSQNRVWTGKKVNPSPLRGATDTPEPQGGGGPRRGTGTAAGAPPRAAEARGCDAVVTLSSDHTDAALSSAHPHRSLGERHCCPSVSGAKGTEAKTV